MKRDWETLNNLKNLYSEGIEWAVMAAQIGDEVKYNLEVLSNYLQNCVNGSMQT